MEKRRFDKWGNEILLKVRWGIVNKIPPEIAEILFIPSWTGKSSNSAKTKSVEGIKVYKLIEKGQASILLKAQNRYLVKIENSPYYLETPASGLLSGREAYKNWKMIGVRRV